MVFVSFPVENDGQFSFQFFWAEHEHFWCHFCFQSNGISID